jgi:dTDP-4-amino-4,6-dideoxygalactose transaminase
MSSKPIRVPYANPCRAYARRRDELLRTFDDVMGKGNLILREELAAFEAHFATFCNVRFAVGVASGYAALSIGLQALQCKTGDKIIVPAHTHVSTCSAVVNIGATPLIVDIRDDFNIDPQCVAEAIETHAGIRAIIPVHMNGFMCNMPALTKIAQDNNLMVIEDACQALGASIDGIAAGAWGNVGCFSFYPFKNLGCYGDGGAIITQSEDVKQRATLLQFNGEDRRTGKYYYHGSSSALDNIHAALLSVNLERLATDLRRRSIFAQQYDCALTDVGDLILQPRPETPASIPAHQNYVIRTKFRDRLYSHLRQTGVEVMVHWRVPYYKHVDLHLYDVSCPVSERISGEIISLPLYPEFDDEEQCIVIDAIKAFFRSKA